MSNHHNTECLILGKKNISDGDRIFCVFSSDFGKIDVFAKAIRKITSKLKSGIDVLSLSKISFIQGKNRKTLIDASLIKNYLNIVCDPQKFIVACDIINVMDLFLKGQEKDEKLFNLIKSSFEYLDSKEVKEEKNNLIYYYFLLNALSILGHKIEVNKCSVCKNPLLSKELYFSAKVGGVICEKCFSKDKNSISINVDLVKILRLIMNENLGFYLKFKFEKNIHNKLLQISNKSIIEFCPKNN